MSVQLDILGHLLNGFLQAVCLDYFDNLNHTRRYQLFQFDEQLNFDKHAAVLAADPPATIVGIFINFSISSERS